MKNRGLLLGALAGLAVFQGWLYGSQIRPIWLKNYAPKNTEMVSGLDPTQMLAAVAGFRELVAGILWVRADSFFDTGNYDAVLPLIRLVTWLDPHQIDVFTTGMWHIGYNFTDEESRSDRRYLSAAIALGKEGARQNPETYELFFETGWIWFHKIDDSYGEAVKWFTDANEREDMLPARRNLLANALFRDGQIDKALEHYEKMLEAAEERLKDSQAYQGTQQRDTVESNMDNTIVRMVQRGYFAAKRNDGSASSQQYDVNPPFDVGFTVRATVEGPKVIRFEGTWNVKPVGTRVRVVLRDADFPNAIPAGANWDMTDAVNLDPDPKLTFMQDQLFVRNQRFNRKVDMSKDPTMYPFQGQKYLIEFYYNPRSAPAHIQDKFGYNGEGMTDKNYLSKDARPNQRVIYCAFEVTRDQLLRRGEWYDKTPVFESKGFNANRLIQGTNTDILMVPGMRSDPSTLQPKVDPQKKKEILDSMRGQR